VSYLEGIVCQTGRKIKVAANFNEHAREHKAMGMDVGSPDLRLSYRLNGDYRVLYLELKKKKGKLSPDQIEWNADFDANFASWNCQRAVAYGYEQAIEIINSWLPLHTPPNQRLTPGLADDISSADKGM